MTAGNVPPEVFEKILQFAPDNGSVGFKVNKHQLWEDRQITNRKEQFGPIAIRTPNQLRLLSRTALAYVRRWKSSKLLCEIKARSDEPDFSKAEVALSFLHSNAVPLIRRIRRETRMTLWRRRHDVEAVPADDVFKGLPDLATSYYTDQIAQIKLHVKITENLKNLRDFCEWFHCFWLYVLETIASAATLPTYVYLTCDAKVTLNLPSNLRASFEDIPNNFQKLDFNQFQDELKHQCDLVDPLLSGCVNFIFNAGRASIIHVAGPLPYILSLGYQPGATAAGKPFETVEQIDATFNESLKLAGAENPLAQLVSLFPSLESLHLSSCVIRDINYVTMDLSPLLGAPNLRHFVFGGEEIGWAYDYVEEFANEPLSKWNIQHPCIRSVRFITCLIPQSDEMPAEHIAALRKLMNVSAGNYECLEFVNIFSVMQLWKIFDAESIKPKLAGLRKLSMVMDYKIVRDTEKLIDSIFRLFALIERTMPHLESLYFVAPDMDINRISRNTGAFAFAHQPEIALLSRFVANRPKQVKELILYDILRAPDDVYAHDIFEQWLLCTLRCLIESNVSCLVLSQELPGVCWPLPVFQRWNANPDIIRDLFKSLPSDATKGKRLQSVKFYTRKRDEEFTFEWDDLQTVELCCVLVNPSTGETQTLRMLLRQWLFS